MDVLVCIYHNLLTLNDIFSVYIVDVQILQLPLIILLPAHIPVPEAMT